MSEDTFSPEDKIYLDIQLIEMRASHDFHKACALGVNREITTPLYGAIFLLAGVENPSRGMRTAASKIAEELTGWANPRL